MTIVFCTYCSLQINHKLSKAWNKFDFAFNLICKYTNINVTIEPVYSPRPVTRGAYSVNLLYVLFLSLISSLYVMSNKSYLKLRAKTISSYLRHCLGVVLGLTVCQTTSYTNNVVRSIFVGCNEEKVEMAMTTFMNDVGLILS